MMRDTLADETTNEWLPWQSELPAELRASWQALLSRMPDAPVFFHPEWLELAMATGACPPVRVLLIRHAEQPVALLPLVSRGPLAWAIADTLCMDTAIQLIDPAREDVAWAGVARAMREHRELGHLSLGCFLSVDGLARLRTSALDTGLPLHARSTESTCHISLPADWSAYLAGLSHSTRDKVRRITAYLNRDDTDTEIQQVTDPDEVDAVADNLISLYRRRWDRQIGGSIFADPRTVAFYRAALRWAVAGGYGALLMLRHAGHPLVVGSVFHIPGQPIAYFHTIARDDHPDSLPGALHSPGIALTALVMQWAVARGARIASMGRGTVRYKQEFGAQVTPLWQPTLSRSSLTDACVPALSHTLHILQRLPIHLRDHLRRWLCPRAGG